MVKNPLIILYELVSGIIELTWNEIVFVFSKLWELFASLSYYSSQNLPLAIFSAILASSVTYIVLRYVFGRIPIKFIFTIVGAIILLFVALLIASIFIR